MYFDQNMITKTTTTEMYNDLERHFSRIKFPLTMFLFVTCASKWTHMQRQFIWNVTYSTLNQFLEFYSNLHYNDTKHFFFAQHLTYNYSLHNTRNFNLKILWNTKTGVYDTDIFSPTTWKLSLLLNLLLQSSCR